MNHLFKEGTELLSLHMRVKTRERLLVDDAGAIKREFALEFADTLAWTAAVANFFGIDLEQAVRDRYGDGCWNCKQDLCRCLTHNLIPEM